jgi:hypothetical protein
LTFVDHGLDGEYMSSLHEAYSLVVFVVRNLRS